MQREFSAGGVVYKKVKGQESKKVKVLWLITKSTPSDLYPKSYWRLPKGWLDDENGGENPGPLARGDTKANNDQLQEAALREVREEGGVGAKIVKKLGTERIFFTKKEGKVLKFVTYFLMEFEKGLPEGFGFETSEIAWLPYDEARKRLKHSGEKKMLDKANELLDSGLQGSLV
jgi:8-oxo-dGTP pyrophosphatase MutT (NUDIX family)